MFQKGYQCETQIVITVFSADQENDSDVIGACAASAALLISDSPFEDAVSEVRIGRVDGKLIVNPTFKDLETSDLDITIAGTSDSILMVEGEASEISENDLIEVLKFAQEAIKKICELQNSFASEFKVSKRVFTPKEINAELESEVINLASEKFSQIASTVLSKDDRANATSTLENEVLEALKEKYPEQESDIKRFAL